MKKLVSILLSTAVILTLFTACGPTQSGEGAEGMYTGITLSDNSVLVGGTPASTDENNAVYVSDDIVFYLEGQGTEYGEGEKDEEHSQSEADKHTVINITKPGNYTITGKISNGQIAVNLGDNAKKDPDAVVNITLNNTEITCTVAPAIICYSAYECGSDDVKTATKDVNTENAGFNITLAEDSYNIIKGSHVAKIYKPGTEDKLHKYDAAIESLVSMNINSENGFLTVVSDNEGIETKMHMTVNGGTLDIKSADDALNAGEDGVSVITVNNGTVWADSNKGVEGDGIDSNGWLVINGGTVYSFGNSNSMDSGLDSDMGIYINGGTVLATGNMYDEISKDSTQNFAVFNFAQPIYDKSVILKSLADNSLTLLRGTAKGSVMVYSSPQLTEGDYELYFADGYTGGGEAGVFTDISNLVGRVRLTHSGTTGGGMMGGRPQMGGFGGQMPQNGEMPPSWNQSDRPIPDRGTPPQGEEKMPAIDFNKEKPKGDIPQAMPTPDSENMPVNFGDEGKTDFQSMPDRGFGIIDNAKKTIFTIVKGANMFSGIAGYTLQ